MAATRTTGVAFAYDAMAAHFEPQRAVPEEVVRSVRSALTTALKHLDRPRLLDLGAGSGRFGRHFVAAGDDYVGVDLSAGMLGVFAEHCAGGRRAILVQADGRALPFADACFDAVLLIAVFGGLTDWRAMVDEARRVLRPGGAIIIGRIAAPEDGIDERMKQRLDTLLNDRLSGVGRPGGNRRKDAIHYLAAAAWTVTEQTVASWRVERSPQAFLDRHAGGARFSRLPRAAREDALRALGDWARTEFGSLDASVAETDRFEMRLFIFAQG